MAKVSRQVEATQPTAGALMAILENELDGHVPSYARVTLVNFTPIDGFFAEMAKIQGNKLKPHVKFEWEEK